MRNEEEILKGLQRKEAELAEATDQLVRYVHVEKEYGVKPWEIKSITLVPKGRNEKRFSDDYGSIEYGSVVIMKNGERHEFDNNIKKAIEGPEYKPTAGELQRYVTKKGN